MIGVLKVWSGPYADHYEGIVIVGEFRESFGEAGFLCTCVEDPRHIFWESALALSTMWTTVGRVEW